MIFASGDAPHPRDVLQATDRGAAGPVFVTWEATTNDRPASRREATKIAQAEVGGNADGALGNHATRTARAPQGRGELANLLNRRATSVRGLSRNSTGDPIMTAYPAFTLDGIQTLHRWTHTSLDLLLNHLSTIPAEDYAKALPAFGFPTLREQVIHILNCEGFWIHSLAGLPYADRNPAECPAVADARLLQQEVSRQTHAYLSGLTDQQLNSTKELRFPEGNLAVRTPALVLHHVLTHAFHHKGQIVAMCRALGHPAPDTHLIQFE